MRNKISIAEYLYFLSVKYEVDFNQLIDGLIQAREKQEASCGKLLIECRRKAIEHDVFLFTNDGKVVAQFFIPKYFLDQPSQFVHPTSSHLLNRIIARDIPDRTRHIRDLRFGMKQIDVKARVLDIPKARIVQTRYGDRARVTNALIADETGTIKLCLWNERVDAVLVDSVVQIKNANVTKFRGENQLTLGKNAGLSMVESNGFPSSKEIERERLLQTAAPLLTS
jgi:Single-stranded DNA binding protein Ssb-like, OB fold